MCVCGWVGVCVCVCVCVCSPLARMNLFICIHTAVIFKKFTYIFVCFMHSGFCGDQLAHENYPLYGSSYALASFVLY